RARSTIVPDPDLFLTRRSTPLARFWSGTRWIRSVGPLDQALNNLLECRYDARFLCDSGAGVAGTAAGTGVRIPAPGADSQRAASVAPRGSGEWRVVLDQGPCAGLPAVCRGHDAGRHGVVCTDAGRMGPGQRATARSGSYRSDLGGGHPVVSD